MNKATVIILVIVGVALVIWGLGVSVFDIGEKDIRYARDFTPEIEEGDGFTPEGGGGPSIGDCLHSYYSARTICQEGGGNNECCIADARVNGCDCLGIWDSSCNEAYNFLGGMACNEL